MQVILEENIILTHLDNEIALLNQKNGRYFSLNETGARAWEAICQSNNTDTAFEAIMNEYNIDEASLKKDIEHFLNQLIEAGIMMPVA